jgi:toxin secretion/phage lysis holin
MTVDEYAALVALGFISLDVITGVIGAWGSKTLSSGKMRVGLTHKLAEFVCLCTGALLDWAELHKVVQLGDYVQFLFLVSLAIIAMELTSIVENLGIIFPELGTSGVLSVFQNNTDFIDKLTTSSFTKQSARAKHADNSKSSEESVTQQLPPLAPSDKV